MAAAQSRQWGSPVYSRVRVMLLACMPADRSHALHHSPAHLVSQLAGEQELRQRAMQAQSGHVHGSRCGGAQHCCCAGSKGLMHGAADACHARHSRCPACMADGINTICSAPCTNTAATPQLLARHLSLGGTMQQRQAQGTLHACTQKLSSQTLSALSWSWWGSAYLAARGCAAHDTHAYPHATPQKQGHVDLHQSRATSGCALCVTIRTRTGRHQQHLRPTCSSCATHLWVGQTLLLMC